MRRLIFVTQQFDPEHAILGATARMVESLAAHVDEIVLLADGVVPAALPANARAYSFGASSQARRGLRFEAALALELHPKPIAVVAHMCPIYAVLAAPVVRPLGIPLLLWFTHWKKSRLLHAAERLSSRVVSVDRRTFPFASPKLVPIGHGVDMDDFPLVERPERAGLRALALGRTSPAKGYEAIIRAVGQARPDVSLDVYGPSASDEEVVHRAALASLVDDLGVAGRVRIHEPVPRTEVSQLLADHDCLVNNMRPGATDKVVYEASSSGLPVLASNPAFDDLFAGLDLAFPTDDVDALAARLDRLAELDAAGRAELGRTLHDRAVDGHSVDAWARKLLEVVDAA